MNHQPRVFNTLFLCTGNSARSVMAESLLNLLGNGRFHAYSAGSHPTGTVHPFAVELLAANRCPVTDLRSKAWDEFSVPGAPPMDFIITVCDNAAGEVCPVWPGKPATAHWGFPDPAAVIGSDDEKREAFRAVFMGIQTRLRAFLSLPLEKLDAMSIQTHLRDIGRTPVSAP